MRAMKTSTTGKPASGRAGAKRSLRAAQRLGALATARNGTRLSTRLKSDSELLERIDRGLTEAEARADRLLGKLGMKPAPGGFSSYGPMARASPR